MRRIVKATLFIALLVFAQGCDSWVEEPEPSTSISQEEGLSNPDVIEGVRAKMYDRMHTTDMSTHWMLAPSAMADNTYHRSGENRHANQNLNEPRSGHVGSALSRGEGAYNGQYDDIYYLAKNANTLISGVEEGVLEEERADRFRAEGLFMRSLGFHQGARVFGYEPDMQPNSGPGEGFDLSIELRTETTLDLENATPLPRSTSSEVYSQLVSDLNEAINLFSEGGHEGSEHFASEAAAHALLARVQLYQRNWSAANTAAQTALDLANDQFGSRLATEDEIRNMAIFDETQENPEAIFTISTDPVGESAGINESLAAFTSQEWMAQMPTQDLLDLYESGDARYDGWYGPCYDDTRGGRPGGCEGVNTHEGDLDVEEDLDEDPPYVGFELQKYSAEQGSYADDYVHLRVAEMVLIQAEAELNENGVTPAINRLNDLRTTRGASELDPSNYDFDSAYDEILDERRRELVAEGHRFFDLKRLGRDIRKVPVRDHSGDDIPYEDYRILDNIPEGEIEVNEELVQSPDYN